MGRVYVAPPPVGGWNTRDPENLMDEKDAAVLDNWFPSDNEVVGRKGYEAFISSGMGSGDVGALAPYVYGTASKLLACTGGNIYEISTGTASSSLASGLSSNNWQWISFGSRTLLFNGVDNEKSYDGTTISNAGWTGVTAGTLFAATVFKSRVYALKVNSQSVLYGGVGAVTGAMTEFNLSQVAGTFGGNVAAVGSMTLDAGAGVDDLIFFIMTTGDCFVYQGSDPGVDFALVGVFKMGAPLGRRPCVRIGAETLVMTRDGIVPMSKVISKGKLSKDFSLSDKISTSYADSVQVYGSTTGWEGTYFADGNKVIFNIPKNAGYCQYVMNARTGAWCRYTGIQATTWAQLGENIYFGSTDGKVYKAETGLSDNGAAIPLNGRQAFNFLRQRDKMKLYSAVRLSFRSSGRVQVTVTMNTDYKKRSGRVQFFTQAGSGTAWDAAAWDSFIWGGDEATRGKWKIVTGKGYCGQVEVTANPLGQRISWQDTSYMYQMAGML